MVRQVAESVRTQASVLAQPLAMTRREAAGVEAVRAGQAGQAEQAEPGETPVPVAAAAAMPVRVALGRADFQVRSSQ